MGFLLEWRPFLSSTLDMVNATTVYTLDANGPGAVGVPANCKSITFLNLDAANEIYFRMNDVALVAGDMTQALSLVLPANASFTIETGAQGERVVFDADTDIYMMSSAGANVLLNITYVQTRGFFGIGS
jgi:hypothetical protein